MKEAGGSQSPPAFCFAPERSADDGCGRPAVPRQWSAERGQKYRVISIALCLDRRAAATTEGCGELADGSWRREAASGGHRSAGRTFRRHVSTDLDAGIGAGNIEKSRTESAARLYPRDCRRLGAGRRWSGFPRRVRLRERLGARTRADHDGQCQSEGDRQPHGPQTIEQITTRSGQNRSFGVHGASKHGTGALNPAERGSRDPVTRL